MFLHFFDGVEEVLIEPVVSHGTIEAFDVGVLLRLSRLDVIDLNLLLGSPAQKRVADVLGAIVTANHRWLATPLDDLFQSAYDTTSG